MNEYRTKNERTFENAITNFSEMLNSSIGKTNAQEIKKEFKIYTSDETLFEKFGFQLNDSTLKMKLEYIQPLNDRAVSYEGSYYYWNQGIKEFCLRNDLLLNDIDIDVKTSSWNNEYKVKLCFETSPKIR